MSHEGQTFQGFTRGIDLRSLISEDFQFSGAGQITGFTGKYFRVFGGEASLSLSLLNGTDTKVSWAGTDLSCTGLGDPRVSGLVQIPGSQGWYKPQGFRVGTDPWVSGLVQIPGYQGWYRSQGFRIGTDLRVSGLVQTQGFRVGTDPRVSGFGTDPRVSGLVQTLGF